MTAITKHRTQLRAVYIAAKRTGRLAFLTKVQQEGVLRDEVKLDSYVESVPKESGVTDFRKMNDAKKPLDMGEPNDIAWEIGLSCIRRSKACYEK